MRRKSSTLKMTDPVPSGREIIQRFTTPTGEWQLQRRPVPSDMGQATFHYEIICNGVFLMASYNRNSDRQLASQTLARVSGDELRVLVGGLGIGYTAQAALEDRRVSRVDIVEIEPLVGAWHREFFAPLCGYPCDDPRTRLVVADVLEFRLAPRTYDAILLDTDNGPGWLVRSGNERLYTRWAAERFMEALRSGGALAYWSAERAAGLAAMLDPVAKTVEEIGVPDEIAPGRVGTAWLYLARKRSEARSPRPEAR